MAQRKQTRKAEIVAPGEGIPFNPGPTLAKIDSQLEDVYIGLMNGTIPPGVADKATKIKAKQMRRRELIVQAARINPLMRNVLWEELGLPVPNAVKDLNNPAPAPKQITDKAA